jgi:hypothetical protein
MRASFLSVVFLLSVSVTSLAADPSSKTLDLYKKASGGAAASNVKSFVMTGAAKVGGETGQFVLSSQAPDRLRIDIGAPGLTLSECYNGKSAWRKQPDGLRTLLGSEAASFKLYALLVGTRLRGLSRYRAQITAGPNPASPGDGFDSLAVSLAAAKTDLFFDHSTHLLMKMERNVGGDTQTITYGDYRKVDTVVEPFSITIRTGSLEVTIAIDHIEHNKALDEGLFSYPQVEGEAPLPDVGAMLHTLFANQEKIEEMREHYTFRELENERAYDGSGHLKDSKDREYEVTPVGDALVHRLVSEGGKPLSDSEREKEDKKVQKEVAEIIKRREKREKKEKQDEGDKKNGEDEEEITVLSFLKACEITSERRETLGSQPVIAFDFEPKKDFKPKNRAESFISKLAGTMWVDQDADQIARLEAHFTGAFKVGGGLLASVAPSTAFVFEQKKIDGEVWLPSYLEANISVKIMLLAKFNRAYTTRYSDYKKYKVNSDYNLKNPPQEQNPSKP